MMKRLALAVLPWFVQCFLILYLLRIEVANSEVSERQLKQTVATNRVNSISLSELSVPNVFEGFHCPGHWTALVTTHVTLGILLSLSFYVTLACTVWLGMYLYFPPRRLVQRRDIWCVTWILPMFLAVLLGLLISGLVAKHLRGRLQVSLPNHWWQVTRCRVSWLTQPQAVLPMGCGENLSLATQRQRLEYYLSFVMLLMLAATFIGFCLTSVRAILRVLCEVCSTVVRRTESRAIYDPLEPNTSMSEAEAPGAPRATDMPVTLCVLTFHALFAGLSLWSMATGHLNVRHGLCWELWLAWVAVMLSISLIQAFYFTVCLPAEARLPGWGLAIVMPVLPVLGEPLDIFKDWLFIGLALSQRMGFVRVACSIGVLAVYIRLRSCKFKSCGTSTPAGPGPVS